MKVTSGRSYIKIRRHFTVEDGPLVDVEHFSTPKKVRVNRGCITYTWQDGEWIVLDAWDVEVSGIVLKKDGTDSKNDHDRKVKARPHDWSKSQHLPALQVADGWEWLQEIIDLLRPDGVLAMAKLTGYEVNG